MEKARIEILHELLRKVVRLIDPVTSDEKIKWLMDPRIRGELFEKFPKCTLPIKYLKAGNFQPYFFVCNRKGMHDPDMINFALKICNKLENLEHIDQDHLCMIKKKLMLMKSRFDKDVPTPFSASYQKARSTMRLNNIMRALQNIRNNSVENSEE
jgi:hypothetical protein